MILNWLDVAFVVILLLTLILGVIKGLVRQVIGIAAVVVGLIVAAMHYQRVSRLVSPALVTEKWAQLIAFFAIFIALLLLGALISILVSKLVQGPLKFIDRLLGGVLGLVKGVLICGVIVMAYLVFPVNKEAVVRSSIAPYCYWLTKGMVQLIPQELKNKFYETYREILGGKGSHGEKI
jgi:membrane protein required for colicin V production